MIDAIVGTFFTPDGPTVNPQYQPPQREWVGLTKMELIKCGVFPWGMSYRLYEAIEAKLKQKKIQGLH